MTRSTHPAGRCHGNGAFGSALLAAGVLFLASTSFVRADSCPEPAVRIEATAATPLTELNYATAETQSLFAGAYVKKSPKKPAAAGWVC